MNDEFYITVYCFASLKFKLLFDVPVDNKDLGWFINTFLEEYYHDYDFEWFGDECCCEDYVIMNVSNAHSSVVEVFNLTPEEHRSLFEYYVKNSVIADETF